MHELGIVFHIIRQVEEIAVSNQVNEVKKVTLEIGEVSGVVPSYLEDCWKWACLKKSEHKLLDKKNKCFRPLAINILAKGNLVVTDELLNGKKKEKLRFI